MILDTLCRQRVMLTFGPPGNLIRFPIDKRLRMTGRPPLGPAKIIEFKYLRHRLTPLPAIPKRRRKA